MQGKAGSLNYLSLLVLDELGQAVSGQADQISASLSLFPAPLDSSSKYIQSVVDNEDGSVNVTWNATAASPTNNSLVYQLNVTLKSSGQVWHWRRKSSSAMKIAIVHVHVPFKDLALKLHASNEIGSYPV